MRLVVLFTIAFSLQISASVYSQEKKLSLDVDNKTIKEVLFMIEEQSDFRFIYQNEKVNLNKKVSLHVKDQTVEAVLRDLFKKEGVQYEISDDNFILINKQGKNSPASKEVMQKRKVTGKVTDANGDPIIGANVVEKGTTNGTITDIDGNYSLTVPDNAVLTVSYIGYVSQDVSVNGRSNLEFSLKENVQGLDEVVVVGYGTQKKVNLTGAVAAVNSEEIANTPSSSLSNSLAGKISGVLVTSGGGKPGVGSSMQIRSVGTWNDATPLYVIDGIVRDKFAFDGLDASEVENLSVLKDGASAAIYGSRAANGVILVTTKKGKVGKPVISYTGSIGLEDATKIPEMANAYEQAVIINDALAVQGYDSSSLDWYADDELEYFKNHSYNWLDEAWKQPLVTRHTVNVNGGNERVRYFLGGTYYYESGSFDNLTYKKYNLRSNVEANITKDLIATLNLSMDVRNDDKPYWRWDSDSDTMYDLYKGLLFRTGMVPPYIDGKSVREVGGTTYVEWSPMEIIDGTNTGYNKKKYSTFDATFGLQYNVPFVKGLSAKFMYNKIIKNTFIKQFCYPYTMYNFKGTGSHNHIPTTEVVGTYTRSDGNFLQEEYIGRDSYQMNFSVNYSNRFGKHDVGALFVYEQSEGYYDELWARGYDYSSMAIDQLNAASQQNPRIDGEGSETARISYVGRVNYGYADKYLLEGSFRYDGSVNFAPKNRWGFFPSGSAAWRISEEDFFKDNVSFIDYMKIRASVGLLGNDAVGGWQWMQRYNIPSSAGTIFGAEALTGGLKADVIPNEDITWEKSLMYNVGFDSNWLKNRLTFNFDVFYKHTYDILGDRLASLPTTMGVTMPAENYAVIDGKGFELELGWNDQIGKDFSYYVKGNLSYSTNELKEMDEAENIRAYQSQIGLNYDREMGYIATGIIRTQEELDALPEGYTIFGKKPELGMLNYKDLRGANSDEPDGIIDENDQDWIVEHTIPPFNFGLSLGAKWRGWSLDVFFQGVAGNDLVMDQRDPETRAAATTFKFWTDHYTSENVDAEFPRMTENNAGYYSTFWRRSGSFIRLKNLNLSYDLPTSIISKIGIDHAKLFFTGSNLCLLMNKLGYYDPEATSIRNYPLMKSYSFGINVNF